MSKKTIEDFRIDDPHRADMLSDAQMEYVDKIRGLETSSEVKRLAKNASQELGEAGTIVQIYAATYYNSLSYWQTHAAAVSELADDRLRAKGDIDWSAVAGPTLEGLLVLSGEPGLQCRAAPHLPH